MNRTVLAATAATTLLVLTGCGGSNDTSDSTHETHSATSTPSGSPSGKASDKPAGAVVDVTIKGGTVTPNGERLDAKVGEPITLQVTSDREGELHVHSTPEQELEYGVGKTTLEVTIDTPGVVDIEDHVADVVVVQLQVS